MIKTLKRIVQVVFAILVIALVVGIGWTLKHPKET